MKMNLKKTLICVLGIFSTCNIFAQRTGDYTILQDEPVSRITKESVIYSEEYIKTIKDLLKITRTNLNRKKIETIPKELERFYDSNIEYQDYDLVNWMAVDSKEGLRVRKSPSLKAEKICLLPDNFRVTITCLGQEVTVDNIKSAWVEILIPRFLWETSEPEFGWVFGGYLKNYEYNIYERTYDQAYENFTLTDEIYFTAEDFINYEYNIPFNSPHLYDILDGNSYYDLYSSQQFKYMEDNDWDDAECAEHLRSMVLNKLKLVQAGICKCNRELFGNYLFNEYWDMVQDMRQMHPVNHMLVTEFGSIITGDSLNLSSDKSKITYTSPKTNKVYEAEIPSEYTKDFEITENDELRIFSYENTKIDLPGPLIRMRKKVYENDVFFHFEFFYYSIVDGKIAKFLEVKSYSDFIDGYGGYFYGSSDDDEEPYLCISFTCISSFYGMTHDDGILFRKCEEYPYIEIAIDTCDNFEIIQTGKTYKLWND